MKRVIAWTMAVALLLTSVLPIGATSASSAQNTVPVANQQGEMHLAGQENVSTLNPVLSTNGPDTLLRSLLHRSLYYKNSQMVTPDLAASLPVYSEDQKSAVINLKTGLKWSDGSPLTATDVKFSIEFYKLEKPGDLTKWLNNIEKVEVLSETQLKITYKQPAGSAVDYLTEIFILPEKNFKTINLEGMKLPANKYALPLNLASGPYKATSCTDQGGVVVISKNPYYEGLAGNLNKIIFQGYTYGTTGPSYRNLLINGQSDVIFSNETDASTYFPGTEYKALSFPVNATDTFYFNTNVTLLKNGLEVPNQFRDPKLMRAISLMIDRDAIIKDAYYGFGSKRDVIIGEEYFGGIKGGVLFNQNIQEAQNLLAEAGWTINPADKYYYREGKKLSFELLTNAENKMRVATTKQATMMLQAYGIDARVKVVDFNTYMSLTNDNQYEVCLGGISYSTAGNFGVSYSSDPAIGVLNKSKWKNEAANALMSAIQATVSESEEKNLADQLQRLIVSEMPSLPIAVRHKVFMTKSHLKNLKFDSNYRFSRNWSEWYFDAPSTKTWAQFEGLLRAETGVNELKSLSFVTNAPEGSMYKILLSPSENLTSNSVKTGIITGAADASGNRKIQVATDFSLNLGTNNLILVVENAGKMLGFAEKLVTYASTRVDGRVKDYNNNVANGDVCSINVFDSNDRYLKNLTVRKDGSFEVVGLQAGTYNLVASPYSQVSHLTLSSKVPVVVGADGKYTGPELSLVLKKPFIEGIALNPDDSPHGSGVVDVCSTNGNETIWQGARGFSAEGKFNYSELPNGDYVLYVYPKEGDTTKGISSGVPFTVNAGTPSINGISVKVSNAQLSGSLLAGEKIPNFRTTVVVLDSNGKQIQSVSVGKLTGTFGIGNLQPGQYRVYARVQNSNSNPPEALKYTKSKEVIIQIGADQKYTGGPLQLKLGEPQVKGIIVSGDTQTPHAYGSINIKNLTTNTWLQGTSANASGQVSIGSLSDGNYQITGYPTGSATQYGKSEPVTIAVLNGVATPSDIQLTLRSNQINGSVVAPDDTPVFDFNTDVRNEKNLSMSASFQRGSGKFSVAGLSDGMYKLIVNPSGSGAFARTETSFKIVNGQALTMDNQSASAMTVKLGTPLFKGILKDANIPVGSGWFSYENLSSGTRSGGTGINSKGEFYVPSTLANGEYKLYVNVPMEYVGVKALPNPQMFTVSGGQVTSPVLNGNKEWFIELIEPQIEVQTSQVNNTYASDSRVEVRDLNNMFIKDAFVNKEGKAYLGGLAAGDYSLILMPSNELTSVSQSAPKVVSVTEGANKQVIQMAFSQPQVTGKLLSPTGEGERSGRVEVRVKNGGFSKTVGTSRSGDYTIGGLPAGTYELIGYPNALSDYGRSKSQEIIVTDAMVAMSKNIQLLSAQLMGTVTLPDAVTPAPYGYISIRKVLGNNQYEYLQGESVNQMGKFSLSGLIQGTYELEAHPNANNPLSGSSVKSTPVAITVNAEGTVNNSSLKLQLNEAAIQGQIKFDKNNTLVNAEYGYVELFKMEGLNSSWVANAEAKSTGKFYFGTLTDGEYFMYGVPDGRTAGLSKSFKTTMTVANGKLTHVNGQVATEILLTLQKAQITSVIKTPSDTPEKWAYCQVFKVNGNDKTWVTGVGSNDKGVISLGGLEPGSYELIAYPNRMGALKASAPVVFGIDNSGVVTGWIPGNGVVLQSVVVFGKMKYDNTNSAVVNSGWVEIYKDKGNGAFETVGTASVWNGEFMYTEPLTDGNYKLRGFSNDVARPNYKNSMNVDFTLAGGIMTAPLNPVNATNEIYLLPTQLSGRITNPKNGAGKHWVEVGSVANGATLQNPGTVTWVMSSVVSEVNNNRVYEMSGLPNGKYVVQAFYQEEGQAIVKSNLILFTIQQPQDSLTQQELTFN